MKNNYIISGRSLCIWSIVFMLTVPATFCFGTIDSTRTEQIQIERDACQIPDNAKQTIELLDYKNTAIKDVLRSLAARYNINVFVDDAVEQRITVRLTGLTVHEVILFIAREYDLDMSLENSIYKITMPELPLPEPKPLKVAFENRLMTVDVEDEDLAKVMRALSEKSGQNIVLNRGVNGRISGFLQNLPFEQGLTTLLKSNGFELRNKDGVYMIDREMYVQSQDGGRQTRSFWVDVQDSLISLDVSNADLGQVIREMAVQMDKDVVVLSELKGNVTAQCTNIAFDDIMDYLLKGTNFTYRKSGPIYLIGDKNIAGISSTQLIQLNHIKADGLIELLPESVTSKAMLQTIREHNAVMAVGTQDVIREVESYIRQIDYPIPQILIEAVVVDFTDEDVGQLGMNAFMNQEADTASYPGLVFPSLDITASGPTINRSLNFYGPTFGIENIGRLPDNFMLRLQALQRDKKANIRSQPQIATLNGHPASIRIGTTQYYRLESYTPYSNIQQTYTQTSQRFEKITAEISLTITPWVSASGEITTEIKPEFSTPRNFGAGNDVPPTIDHRIIESTVRLRDGETIVLGGLIQDETSNTVDKTPVLGDIPVLGRLFQNRGHRKARTKLMIYITPHLNYSETPYAIEHVDFNQN